MISSCGKVGLAVSKLVSLGLVFLTQFNYFWRPSMNNLVHINILLLYQLNDLVKDCLLLYVNKCRSTMGKKREKKESRSTNSVYVHQLVPNWLFWLAACELFTFYYRERKYTLQLNTYFNVFFFLDKLILMNFLFLINNSFLYSLLHDTLVCYILHHLIKWFTSFRMGIWRLI